MRICTRCDGWSTCTGYCDACGSTGLVKGFQKVKMSGGCQRNEMGRYPSCVSAVLDGPGAEGHGMCGDCSQVAKQIYDAYRNTLKGLLEAMENGVLTDSDGGHPGDWMKEIRLAIS